MKTDQEFIQGIYEKAQKINQHNAEIKRREKLKEKLRNFRELINWYRLRTVGSLIILVFLTLLLIPFKNQSSDEINFNQGDGTLEDSKIRSIETPIESTQEGKILKVSTINGEQYLLIEQVETKENKILKVTNDTEVILPEVSVGCEVEYTFINLRISLSEEDIIKLKREFRDYVDVIDSYVVIMIKRKE